jgi:hypothetical protein
VSEPFPEVEKSGQNRGNCPTCGAPRQEPAVCYRCKSDLAPLVRLEREADALRAEARRCYARGWYRRAAVLAGQILRIEASDADFHLLVCACLRCGDFQTACQAYARVRGRGG